MHAAAGRQRAAEARSDTEQSNCGVTASPVPPRHRWRALAGVCTRDALSVAEIGGGEREAAIAMVTVRPA